jgi:hypothetical protein
MAVTINASTSAGLVMTSDLSGVLTLQQNGVSLPNGGVAPAFSAYANANQNITQSVLTKVQINTENFDTNNNFDNATNYRFTPTVAGYYLITGNVEYSTSAASGSYIVMCTIYKNGSAFAKGTQVAAAATNNASTSVTSVIYFNGSTDYVELYTYQNVSNPLATLASDSGNAVRFEGCLVRGA